MTREETVKFIYEILKKHSVKVNEVDVIPVSSCIALVGDIINHETDLVKEFVKQYTNVLIKDYNDKAWMMNHTEEQEIEDRWFYRGQCTAIQRLIVLLDGDLEKFLEEKMR